MASLMDRYLYEVTRRLPEKDREEVRRELRSNICDMLEDGADEAAVAAVLTGLGPPAALAESYRQKPRYLISPAVYDDYIRALKWVVPLVGCILLAVGAVLGAIGAIQGSPATLGAFMGGIFSRGLSLGLSGAVHALVWTTAGFAITERVNAKTAPEAAWTVEDLPEEIPSAKGHIPLSDSVASLVMVVVFSAIALAFCLGGIPFAFMLQSGSMRVHQLFSSSFLAACVPAIIIGGLFGVGENVVKILRRRWTPLVCGAVVVSNLVSVGLMLILFTRPSIFSAELLAFLDSQDWAHTSFRLMGTPMPLMTGILFIIGAIVVISSLAECAAAVYRTVRAAGEGDPPAEG